MIDVNKLAELIRLGNSGDPGEAQLRAMPKSNEFQELPDDYPLAKSLSRMFRLSQALRRSAPRPDVQEVFDEKQRERRSWYERERANATAILMGKHKAAEIEHAYTQLELDAPNA